MRAAAGGKFNERYGFGGRHSYRRIHDDPVMNAVAAWRDKQGTKLVHNRDQWMHRWRIEYNFCQHESVLCWMAGKIDAGCMSYHAPGAISSNGIARRKTEGYLAVSALEDNAIRTRLYRFDEVAAPDVHTKFQRPLFEERLGRGLRQEQCKGKARVERREI